MQHSWLLFRKAVFSIIVLAAFTGCKGDQRLVNARGGLYSRQSPSPKAKAIELLPNGTQVKFIEETGSNVTLDGVVGKWTKIKNIKTGKEGWVFGGFLEIVDPGVVKTVAYGMDAYGQRTQYMSISGTSKSYLAKNATSLYKSTAEVSDVIGSLASVAATVSYTSANGCREGCTRPFAALWILKAETWQPHPQNIAGRQLHLMDVNGDGLSDTIVIREIPFEEDPEGQGRTVADLYLAKANGAFTRVQQIRHISTGGDFLVKANGKCDANRMQYDPKVKGHSEITYVFDCRKGQFVISK